MYVKNDAGTVLRWGRFAILRVQTDSKSILKFGISRKE
jgi:hypothetical protein